MHGLRFALPALLLVLAVPALGAAPDPGELITRITDAASGIAEDPGSAVQDPQGVVDSVLDEGEPAAEEPGAPKEGREVGFADRIRDAFRDEMMVAGLATAVVSALGVGGFAFVTRYVSPKEALKNPQRAMLYGFVRGNPGVHLKKLSEEFAMKTSSILWHIRKLEAAELVRSERANGFRVFYPVDGGIEIKRVSRAITALQNRNARALFESLERHPGANAGQLSTRLAIHSGTVRWHLRKLREFGLVEELVRDDGSRYFPTPLGKRSLETLAGVPTQPAPLRVATPVAVAE